MYEALKMNLNSNPQFVNWKNSFDVEKKPWGLTNELFLLNKKYVLRRSDLTTPFTNYQQEITVLTHLARKEITVPIVGWWKTAQTFYLVTVFQPHSFPKQLTMAVLMKIAIVIKNLQKQPQLAIKKFAFKPHLLAHWKLAKITLQKELKPSWEALKTFLEEFKISNWVLAHNDLVLENFLFTDKQTYLIDFERSSLNTPLYDPACVIAETQLWKMPAWWKLWSKIWIKTPKDEHTLIFLTLYRLFIGYLWATIYYQHKQTAVYLHLQIRKASAIQTFYTRKVMPFVKKKIK